MYEIGRKGVIGAAVPVNRLRRTAVAVVIVVLGALAASILVGIPVQAHASDTPAPDATPGHTPKPKASESPSPTPTPTPSPTPTPRPDSSPSPSPKPSDGSGDATASSSTSDGDTQTSEGGRTRARKKGRHPKEVIWWDLQPSFGGTYTTATLLGLEDRLREMGASRKELRKLFRPFIIGGHAQFSDTWGAVRHGHGNKLRPHVGQDVFCRAGAPVLAAESGEVEFAQDRLGGTVVRLHRTDGGYWYYAHLARYAKGLVSGDQVKAGDVIGHCGTTGNARGGTPHVHFGSYPGPVNPMGDLVSWLATAERNAEQRIDEFAAAGKARPMKIETQTPQQLGSDDCACARVAENDLLDLIVPPAYQFG